MSEDKTLFHKIRDTIMIAATYGVVFSSVVTMFGFVWTKVSSMDDNISKANEGVIATQEVHGERLERVEKATDSLSVDIGRLRDSLSELGDILSDTSFRPPELSKNVQNYSVEQKALSPVRSATKNYKK